MNNLFKKIEDFFIEKNQIRIVLKSSENKEINFKIEKKFIDFILQFNNSFTLKFINEMKRSKIKRNNFIEKTKKFLEDRKKNYFNFNKNFEKSDFNNKLQEEKIIVNTKIEQNEKIRNEFIEKINLKKENFNILINKKKNLFDKIKKMLNQEKTFNENKLEINIINFDEIKIDKNEFIFNEKKNIIENNRIKTLKKLFKRLSDCKSVIDRATNVIEFLKNTEQIINCLKGETVENGIKIERKKIYGSFC
jgi:hypothetical protein